MNRIDIMLDLETWGTHPGCDIRSIGAVVFDPVAGLINHLAPQGGISQFYIACNNPTTPHEQSYCEACGTEWHDGDIPRYPLTRDPETVQWWNQQSPDAQAAFANPVDLRDACQRFGEWLGAVNDGEPSNMSDHHPRIWANDPHFDVSILDAVYRAVGLPIPWHYRAPRSMKTIVEAAGMTRDDMAQFNHGTAHNALDDAISQAMIVCEAYKRLGLQK